VVGIDTIDRNLLDAMQAGIPLVERQYRAIGEGLGLAEGDVLGRVARLKVESLFRADYAWSNRLMRLRRVVSRRPPTCQ